MCLSIDEFTEMFTGAPIRRHYPVVVRNANLDPASSPGIQSSSWAEVVKKTIEERDYDKEAEKTVVLYNITDSDDTTLL